VSLSSFQLNSFHLNLWYSRINTFSVVFLVVHISVTFGFHVSDPSNTLHFPHKLDTPPMFFQLF